MKPGVRQVARSAGPALTGQPIVPTGAVGGMRGLRQEPSGVVPRELRRSRPQGRGRSWFGALPQAAIGAFAALGDLSDDDQTFLVVDPIDDTIPSNSDAV